MSNASPRTSRVYFVFLDIENAPLRATNAGQPLYWDQGLGGEKFEWLGAGSVSEISGLGSNTQMSVESIILTVSAIKNEHLVELDENQYLGRKVQIWQCDLSANYQVEKAVLRFQGNMDSAGIRRGSTSTISMNCKSAHATWNRRDYARLNHEQQQDKYPGDMGLEYVASLVSASLSL